MVWSSTVPFLEILSQVSTPIPQLRDITLTARYGQYQGWLKTVASKNILWTQNPMYKVFAFPKIIPSAQNTMRITVTRDLKIWGRHLSRTPPEVRFRLKISLRMSVCEWDGVSHEYSIFLLSHRACVVRKTWVCFCFWSSNYSFLSPFSLFFSISYC